MKRTDIKIGEAYSVRGRKVVAIEVGRIRRVRSGFISQADTYRRAPDGTGGDWMVRVEGGERVFACGVEGEEGQWVFPRKIDSTWADEERRVEQERTTRARQAAHADALQAAWAPLLPRLETAGLICEIIYPGFSRPTLTIHLTPELAARILEALEERARLDDRVATVHAELAKCYGGSS